MLLITIISVLLASAVGGFAATFLCRKMALRLGIVDKPDELVKTHKEPVAYLGGIGILCGFITGLIVSIFLVPQSADFQFSLKVMLGILAAGLIACVTGTVDDVRDIKPYQKILGQTAAAVVLVLAGIRPILGFAGLPAGLEIIISIVVSFVFVLGATNSLNLIDGLDGLCGGVTAIIAAGMLALAMIVQSDNSQSPGNYVRIIMAVCLLGGVCGFLPWNRNPARIFMGDAGSLFLGVVSASLMMLFAAEGLVWCVCSIVIFGLPILDTAVAFARRFLNKRPFFVSDRGHVYDQMMDRGLPLKKTVRICYCIAVLYAVLGLVISQLGAVWAIAASVGIVIVSALIIWKKGFLKMEGLRGAVRKE